MDLKKRLEFCKKCQNRKFSDTGIICSLTEKKPDFINKCNDFVIDPKQAQKILAKAQYSENYDDTDGGIGGKSIWGVIAVVFIIIKIIWRLTRD